ncbi:MAG TPA: GFA family protein [Myxococcota bacterium]|nr:GFA family protein [Myxococcota bacterium]
MKIEGGCYCKGLRYKAEGDPLFKGQCHCRECQYFSGGDANVIVAMPLSGFSYTKGTPKGFARKDLQGAVTREFCPDCGTHILTRAPTVPGAVILKVGTMDDPKQYGGPQMAIYTIDKQPFHQIPAGIPTFERVPGRG